MKKSAFCLSLLSLLICSSCSKKNEAKEENENYNRVTNVFHLNENDELIVVNFADVQFTNPAILENDDSSLVKTIKKAIQESKPNLITFSGDNGVYVNALDCYVSLCDFMDQFEIPYYFALGNHDTEHVYASRIFDVINSSKYGYVDEGPGEIHGRHNYVIDIKNHNEQLVHSIFMMDSGDYYENNPENILFANERIQGFTYSYYQGRPYYGSTKYDGVRDEQIDWYKNEVQERNVESTVIMHMPFREYAIAYEQYLKAVRDGNQTLIDEAEFIEGTKMNEAVCAASTDFGFFNAIKEQNSTKNVIVGHDHNNDYSLVYQGVRLTYAVKTGLEAYCIKDGSMNGYTKLTISENGKGTISQHLYNPLTE